MWFSQCKISLPIALKVSKHFLLCSSLSLGEWAANSSQNPPWMVLVVVLATLYLTNLPPPMSPGVCEAELFSSKIFQSKWLMGTTMIIREKSRFQCVPIKTGVILKADNFVWLSHAWNSAGIIIVAQWYGWMDDINLWSTGFNKAKWDFLGQHLEYLTH